MNCFVNQICYGELTPQNTLMNFQYVVASLEAVECYTPITTDAQDGVDNCLTEALLDKFFNNITEITGLCFLPKESTYRPAALPDPETLGPLGLGGGDWDLTGGGTIDETIPPVDIPAEPVPK